MVIKFTCEYDGTDFCGFQRQKNGISVQQILEESLSGIFGEKIVIHASGRTDTGVHARAQVCSFKVTNDKLEISGLGRRMNSVLHESIAVRDFQVMGDDFSARFSVKGKKYLYRCYVSQSKSPLRDRFALQLYKSHDIASMQKAANMLMGTHDFSAFCCVRTDKEDKVRTIHELRIESVGGEINFWIRGNGFLRNMVRIIVGTLLDVGVGKISVDDVYAILESKDRNRAGKTADARGLTLWCVEY